MINRCLVCGFVAETPRRLEVHLQIEHRLNLKKPVKHGLDSWCD